MLTEILNFVARGKERNFRDLGSVIDDPLITDILIPEFLGYITRRGGQNFLNLDSGVDDPLIIAERLGGKGGIPLYVHIPFCRSLCPFCCFNRYLFEEDQARRYFSDLKQELELYIRSGFDFSSIYFGGGTPTILMDELTDFIEYLHGCFKIKEISLETNPGELTRENIMSLKQAGISRLSIGVQSFEEVVLKNMGRENGPADELKNNLCIAEGNFDTLNIDFLFNFPGQTVEQFSRDVDAFKELGIDQATFYPLMASPNKKEAMARRFNWVNKSHERQFYDVIMKELYHGGYTASTAWCYSRGGGKMIDEYIIEYDDYIGIGTGSMSIIRGAFYVNSFSLDRYHELTSAGRLPIVGQRHLTEQESLRYYLLTKLFGMRLDTEAFQRRFGAHMGGKLWSEVTFLRSLGLVSGDGELRVTEKGMYPVSVMMRDFFAALNGLREYCIENQV